MDDWYDYLRLPVVYEHTSWNVQAASELARGGFVREGLLRSYRLVRGAPGNFYMYSHVLVAPTVSPGGQSG